MRSREKKNIVSCTWGVTALIRRPAAGVSECQLTTRTRLSNTPTPVKYILLRDREKESIQWYTLSCLSSWFSFAERRGRIGYRGVASIVAGLLKARVSFCSRSVEHFLRLFPSVFRALYLITLCLFRAPYFTYIFTCTLYNNRGVSSLPLYTFFFLLARRCCSVYILDS